jgi:hypothetical protein
MDVTRAAQALAPRVASSLLKLMRRRRTLNIQYSIENIQLLKVCENIPVHFFSQNARIQLLSA